MQKVEELESLVRYMVMSLVDKPDEVKISTAQGEHSSVIELTVAGDDIGKVIGKQGRTAVALRTIVSNAAGKFKTNAILQIIEPERASRHKN